MTSIQKSIQCKDSVQATTMVHPADTPMSHALVELAKWMSLLMIPTAMGIAAWVWMFLSLEGTY